MKIRVWQIQTWWIFLKFCHLAKFSRANLNGFIEQRMLVVCLWNVHCVRCNSVVQLVAYKLIRITVVFTSLFAAALTRLNCLKGLNNTARTRQQWIAIWDWVEMSERAVNSQKSSFSSVLVKQSTRYFPLRKLVISAKSCFEKPRNSQVPATYLEPQVIIVLIEDVSSEGHFEPTIHGDIHVMQLVCCLLNRF